jgi:transposase
MAAAIAEVMKEMKEIVSELKKVNSRAKQLRDRKKELEGSIMEYIEETGSPGIKYQDLIILKSEINELKNKK